MRPDQQAELLRRLRCAAGHLNAVIEMAESNKPCEEVLHQLRAVEAALHIAGAKLIKCQAEAIRGSILRNSSLDERMAELSHLQSLYKTFIKYSDHLSEGPYD